MKLTLTANRRKKKKKRRSKKECRLAISFCQNEAVMCAQVYHLKQIFLVCHVLCTFDSVILLIMILDMNHTVDCDQK